MSHRQLTDDEAFLRAIVDAPGDDAPRLVYADWLDERGDPRGAYLRAEVKSGRLEGLAMLAAKEQLQAHAAKLDPVWVARVSRPPYGVCCDRVRFLEAGPAVSAGELDTLAVRLGMDLPVEYRAFLLNWNGGTPDPNHLRLDLDGVPGQYAEVERFFSTYPPTARPTGQGWLDDLEESAQVLRGDGFPNIRIEDYLPIATAGDDSYLLLGVREPALGEVAYVADYTRDSTEAGTLRSVSHTFAWFLAILTAHDPEWVRLIWSGQLAKFVRWLDMGGDPDAFYDRTGESALEVAASSEQWEVVAELLRRGADISEAIRGSLETNAPTFVRRLVRAQPRP